MIIRPTSFTEILAQKDLLREYALECSIAEIGEADPQVELYAMLEASGQFKAFGVYSDADKMMGFACVLMYSLPHYGKKIASTESIFISKEFRHAGSGFELIYFVEHYAKEQGCVAFMMSAPVESRFNRMLAVWKKCRHTNNVYLRSLQ